MCPASRLRPLEQESTDGASKAVDGAAGPLSPDDRFHVLQTSRRRDAMRYLDQASEPVEVRELAEWVASREHGTDVEALDSSQRQRVYISLYQTHLPKLDEYAIVDYDKDRGTVEPTPRLAEFTEYLYPTAADEGDRWWQAYGLLAGIGAALLAGSTVQLVAVPVLVVSVILLASLVLVTVVHALSSTGRVSVPTERLERWGQ